MQLHFEPDLDYQQQAITAVADLFRGQEVGRTAFTVTRRDADSTQASLGLDASDLGVGNRLALLDDELLANLQAVQLGHGLPISPSLASRDFTVEMETGTGKTYVYLRSVFELNRRYGFTKFVVVVPSVAIKEGVYKTLQMTETHFRALYANTPFEFFLYDSAKLGQVRNFATSATVQVMVVTVGAINKKDVNNLYKETEKTGGERPIDLVRATRPVVIVDEPQSVDGGLTGAGRQVLAEMHPLCTLRYSATHADAHHMIYRLNAVDAYERQLVKQIEVASLVAEDAHNTPYVRVKSVRHRPRLEATLELLVRSRAGHVAPADVKVRAGDDLRQTTDNPIYEGVQVGDIDTRGDGTVEVRGPGFDATLARGEAYGGVDEDQLRRLMIRRTVREHLDKEQRLRPLGIKVLTLFFVDAVAHYRHYGADSTVSKGKYALIFEEEYRRETASGRYRGLFDATHPAPDAADVHDGYFSQDRRGAWTDTSESNAGGREAAERAYALIMRDKERLLSFDTPLRFIFSHSALREGWDNPNVFQICVLREIGTETARRQTIGRGLRLCVDQTGARRRGFDVNTLTVVATESYETFAEGLQQEIERDTGVRFGVVERHQFAGLGVADSAGKVTPLGAVHSETLWRALQTAGYLDARGKVQDTLRVALRQGTLALPEHFEAQRAAVTEVLRKAAGRLEVKNADERRTVRTRQAVLEGEAFRALWDRIKHKTTYRVAFDNDALVADCTTAVRDMPAVPRARVRVAVATLEVDAGGVRASDRVREGAPMTIGEQDVALPDVLSVLQDATQLTRRTIARVLVDSGRLDDFRANPQRFIALAGEAIARTKRLALVDGIRYRRLGAAEVFAQELFAAEELTGYFRNLLPSTRSPYEQVVYDSGVEEAFARQLEGSEAVKVYAKLPGWFTVPTPLGTYNPDWAVLVEDSGGERLYFVVETKGGLFADDLRDRERAKVECGRAHFRALGEGESCPAEFRVARTLDDVLLGDAPAP